MAEDGGMKVLSPGFMAPIIWGLQNGYTEEEIELERYSQFVDGWGDEVLGLKQHPKGEWVKFDDVAAFAKQRDERRGIYIASKVAHARRWRLLRDKIGYPIISTWIDEAGEGESKDLADLWRRCIAEASSAEVLVLNREPNEVLKGGWIELGAALAAGVPVLAVGIEKFTVAHDKRIRHFASMADAMTFLKPMCNGVPFRALSDGAGE